MKEVHIYIYMLPYLSSHFSTPPLLCLSVSANSYSLEWYSPWMSLPHSVSLYIPKYCVLIWNAYRCDTNNVTIDTVAVLTQLLSSPYLTFVVHIHIGRHTSIWFLFLLLNSSTLLCTTKLLSVSIFPWWHLGLFQKSICLVYFSTGFLGIYARISLRVYIWKQNSCI